MPKPANTSAGIAQKLTNSRNGSSKETRIVDDGETSHEDNDSDGASESDDGDEESDQQPASEHDSDGLYLGRRHNGKAKKAKNAQSTGAPQKTKRVRREKPAPGAIQSAALGLLTRPPIVNASSNDAASEISGSTRVPTAAASSRDIEGSNDNDIGVIQAASLGLLSRTTPTVTALARKSRLDMISATIGHADIITAAAATTSNLGKRSAKEAADAGPGAVIEKKKRIPIMGSDVATGWLFASVPQVLRKHPSDPAVNYHVFGIDDFVAGHQIIEKTSEEESRVAVVQYFVDNKGAQEAALTRLRQNFRSALHGPISKLLEKQFQKRGMLSLEMSPVQRVQQVESWLINPNDIFMNNLLSLPEKPEFVLAGGMTPARKAYYVTAALSLASRVGEDKEKTERKFGGRTEESMPKSLKDKAPACVTEAFFEIDCAALALRDAEEDSALIGTAAPVEEASKIRTLHQLLDRSLLIVNAHEAAKKASAGGRNTVTPTKVGTSTGTAASTTSIGRRMSTPHGTVTSQSQAADLDVPSSAAAEFRREPLDAKGLYQFAKRAWNEVFLRMTDLHIASGLVEHEKNLIRFTDGGYEVLEEAMQLCCDASPQIFLAFNEANEKTYRAERLRPKAAAE